MKKILLLGALGLIGCGIKRLLKKDDNPLNLVETREDIFKKYNKLNNTIIHLEKVKVMLNPEYILKNGEKILLKDELTALREELKELTFKIAIFKALENKDTLEKMKISLRGN